MRPIRRGRARQDRGWPGVALLAHLSGGAGIAAVLIVGLALQMQLLVLREAASPRIERQPLVQGEIDHVSMEIWRTGDVWLEGRWLGVWVRDGRKDRWVGEDVESEIDRLLALAPDVRIEIDFDRDTPPDLIWRVVNQVGLEHLLRTYRLPPLPQLPGQAREMIASLFWLPEVAVPHAS